jgi:type IV fimbrial biogenesis protein FimT
MPTPPASLPSRRQARGFTLIELMISVTLIGILLGLGMPSYARLMATNRMATQTNGVVSMLNLARSEAVRRGQAIAVRADQSNADFAGGWKIFTDANADGAIPSTTTASDGTVLRQETAAPGRTTIKRVLRSGTAPDYTYADADSSVADRQYVVFNARGGNGADQAIFFRVCDASNTALAGRIVQVSTVGRISLDSTTATCS